MSVFAVQESEYDISTLLKSLKLKKGDLDRMEKALRGYCKIFNSDYKFLIFEIYGALKHSYTVDQVIENMTLFKPYEEWSINAKENLEVENLCKRRLEKPIGTIKGVYRCNNPSCKGHDEFLPDEKQTRGGDEGATLFVICTRCGNKKKIGS